MRLLLVSLALLFTSASPALAKASQSAMAPGTTKANDAVQLGLGAKAVVNAAAAQSRSSQSADPDQGDDHAAARAIQIVCSKDTPAAQRSAICQNVSPE
jgi:hypothetical protein